MQQYEPVPKFIIYSTKSSIHLTHGVPYMVCEEYAKGNITRQECFEMLSQWKYAPTDQSDGIESLIIDVPGSWDDMEKAYVDGLIDATLYDEILESLCGDDSDSLHL